MTDDGEPAHLFNSTECSRETILEGFCYGLSVCGFCYDGGAAAAAAVAAAADPSNVTTIATSAEAAAAGGGGGSGGHGMMTPAYETFNLLFIGFILPAIGCFGLIGDGLSAFIYSRREMLSSLNVYLCALAISDITIILTSFFLFWLEQMRARSPLASYWFASTAPIMFPLGCMAQSLSVFLTVTAAFDCFLLVAAPARWTDRFCTVRSSLKMLCVVITLSVLYNSPRIFEIYVIDCYSISEKRRTKDVCPTELRMNTTYLQIYYIYLYTAIMALGPVLILLGLNLTIVALLMWRARNAKSTDDASSASSDIITLVLVVSLFIACNGLPLTVNFLEMFLDLTNPYLVDLSNLMVVVNSSCNFLIYYTFGANFRKTLKQYMHTVLANRRWWCWRKTKNDSGGGGGGDKQWTTYDHLAPPPLPALECLI